MDNHMKKVFGILLSILLFVTACDKSDKHVTEDDIINNFPIDFSMVGYQYGEKSIPDYPVLVTLTAPDDGSDATSLIQDAINGINSKGAILLKEGTYNISGRLVLSKSNIVLRGEGATTVIKATGTTQRTLLTLGKSTDAVYGGSSPITDNYVPVGQFWVTVENGSMFSVGDRVNITAGMNDAWISDLKMDKIAQNSTNTVVQWRASEYVFRWERHVVKVEGNKVWFDAPIVMQLESKYVSELKLQHVSWDRITESGVENLKLDTEYDVNDDEDEDHAWSAIDVKAAEHCWIRDVRTTHFGYCAVELKQGSKNITVKDCRSTKPISTITGSRRYAFHINGGQYCLVEGCVAREDRHGYVTGARTTGPNVFLDCKMILSHSEIGPHHRWSTGVLYDNCQTDGQLAVYDRAGHGTGHGWTGVSFVFWNCSASKIICQNPWVSGTNWCIGCIGTIVSGRDYYDNLVRPDGVWLSRHVPVTPTSLYRHQLNRRIGSAL